MKHCTLLYPPGAGGSWLISTLHVLPWQHNMPHFHHVWLQPQLMQNIHHRMLQQNTALQHLIVFNGQSWFNFYLNVVYKLYHLERGWTSAAPTKFIIDKMIDLVSVIREHESYAAQFEWEWLLYDRGRMYQAITNMQRTHQQSCIAVDDFAQRCDHYVGTCVNPVPYHESWNNVYWLCAVLGQAKFEKHDVCLKHYTMDELNSVARCVYNNLSAVPCSNAGNMFEIPPCVIS